MSEEKVQPENDIHPKTQDALAEEDLSPFRRATHKSTAEQVATDEEETSSQIMDKETDVTLEKTISSTDNAPLSGSTELTQALEDARREAKENLDLAMRNQAELENARKRAAKEVEHTRKYALERFLIDLLPVLDGLELGIATKTDEEKAAGLLREGMELTLKNLLKALHGVGVEVVNPELVSFDPEHHEAVSTKEDSEHEAGTVLQVMRKGYLLNGRLLRAAMVVVNKPTTRSH